MESRDSVGPSSVGTSLPGGTRVPIDSNLQPHGSIGALIHRSSSSMMARAPEDYSRQTYPPSSENVSSAIVVPVAMPLPLPVSINMSMGFGKGSAGGSRRDSTSHLVKRKRGRPRKYGPDGGLVGPLNSFTFHRPPAPLGGTSGTAGKRGRGRPRGSGPKQQLASLGECLSKSAGLGFTPHVITIPAGEDVATKIMAFSQQGPRSICILSANGAISHVTLRQPATSGGTVTYEGRFEILSLSGSFLLTEMGGTRSRTGGLSVSLSRPDGGVMGGGVAGMLMAATPVQVVVGSFLVGGWKSSHGHGQSSSQQQAVSKTWEPSNVPTNVIPVGHASGMREGYEDRREGFERSPYQNTDVETSSDSEHHLGIGIPSHSSMGWLPLQPNMPGTRQGADIDTS